MISSIPSMICLMSSSKFIPGNQVNEIADKCGVSRTTVLHALNNQSRVSDAARKRILDVAKEIISFFSSVN